MTGSTGSLVHTEIIDQIAIITLDHPSRNNALGAALIDALATALAADEIRNARAAVLTGTGSCFSAGFDISEIDPDQPSDTSFPDERLEEAIDAIRGFHAPVVAALNGHAYGGGLDLAMACDLRVTHAEVRLAMTPCKLGIVYPATGLMRFLVRLGPQISRRLFLSAAPLTAEQAERLGIVDELVDASEVRARALDLASEIAGNAPLAVQGTRRALQALESRLALQPELAEQLERLKRDAYASRDLREGVAAFIERRKPEFEGR